MRKWQITCFSAGDPGSNPAEGRCAAAKQQRLCIFWRGSGRRSTYIYIHIPPKRKCFGGARF